MRILKFNNVNLDFCVLILVLLSLFSPIFEYLTSIKILSELIASIIFLFLLFNIKKNIKKFTSAEILIFTFFTLYLLFYLQQNITENTLYKTLSLMFSISFFFFSKYLINFKNELIFICKKITSLIIIVFLLINFSYFVRGEIYSLDQFFSIIISILSMSVLIYDFVKKKFDYEDYLHLMYILYSSQIKILILLIATISFLALIYSNDKVKLKNYLKFLYVIIFCFFISYFFSLTNFNNKAYANFFNIQSIFVKSKQLIYGHDQDLSHKPIIGLKNINQFNFEENLENLSTQTDGPAYYSINRRLTDWQIAINKIKENKSFIKLSGLEDSVDYYHNVFLGITVNYGYSGLTIFIFIIFFIIFNIRKDIIRFFQYKIMSERIIFLLIAINTLVFYCLSMPFYHVKFLALFFGLAYFFTIKDKLSH